MQRKLLLNGRGGPGSRARALHGRRGAPGEICDADGVDGRGDGEDEPFGRKRRGKQAAHGEQGRYANECCSAKKPSVPEHSLPPLVERFNSSKSCFTQVPMPVNGTRETSKCAESSPFFVPDRNSHIGKPGSTRTVETGAAILYGSTANGRGANGKNREVRASLWIIGELFFYARGMGVKETLYWDLTRNALLLPAPQG